MSPRTPLDPRTLAEAVAAVALDIPPMNDRERAYWRAHEGQLAQARAVAAEYDRLIEAALLDQPVVPKP